MKSKAKMQRWWPYTTKEDQHKANHRHEIGATCIHERDTFLNPKIIRNYRSLIIALKYMKKSYFVYRSVAIFLYVHTHIIN